MGGPVGTMRNHCLHNVSHPQYSGLYQNVITGQTLRISRAVNSLMMLENNFSNGPGKLDGTQYFIGNLRMRLYQTEFIFIY